MLNRGRFTDRAQQLRKQMTPQERKLWYTYLKGRPEGFRRQKVLGAFIVDFYCPSCRLVIEVDGGQHYHDAAERADELRSQWLESQGMTVLRYTNADIDRRFPQVCADIQQHCIKNE